MTHLRRWMFYAPASCINWKLAPPPNQFLYLESVSMNTARTRILSHLKKNRSISAREIARALRMSTPDVRYHLGVLVSDGRAEVISTRPREGKGRPEKLYSISRVALGDNLARLVDALLAEAGVKVGMEAVAKRMFTDHGFAGQPMVKRLALAVEKLNEMNYQARWEAGAEGPRVILGLCPYSVVIEKHPELCRMDEALLSGLLETDVEQRAKLMPFCVFSVR